VLKEHITFGKIEVKNPELPKDLIDKKAGILDIKAELNENQICDYKNKTCNELLGLLNTVYNE